MWSTFKYNFIGTCHILLVDFVLPVFKSDLFCQTARIFLCEILLFSRVMKMLNKKSKFNEDKMSMNNTRLFQLIILSIFIVLAYGCDFIAAGSNLMAERYKFEVSKDSLMHRIKVFYHDVQSVVLSEPEEDVYVRSGLFKRYIPQLYVAITRSFFFVEMVLQFTIHHLFQ